MEQNTVKISYVDAQSKKQKVYVTKKKSLVKMVSEFYSEIGYIDWVIMRPIVKTSNGYHALPATSVCELERWLSFLIESNDKKVRTIAASVISKIVDRRDNVGKEITRVFELGETCEPEKKTSKTQIKSKTKSKVKKEDSGDSEEDTEGDSGENTEESEDSGDSEKSPLKSPKDSSIDEMSLASPFEMLSLNDAEMSENRTPEKETKNKRPRASPPGKSASSKKRKVNGKSKSRWVSDEYDSVDYSEYDGDIMLAIFNTASEIDEPGSRKFWEFILHPPTYDETTFQLTSDFSNNDFWDWFEQIAREYPSYGFDFDKAEQVSRSLTGEYLIDAVVRAGLS